MAATKTVGEAGTPSEHHSFGETATPITEAELAEADGAVHIKCLEGAETHRVAGNDLLTKGDFADACTQYDEGLLKLTRVGDPHQERANELRLALHLNASLGHLRRANLRSAADHASGALAIDSSNEKALFRRGSARSRLAEHPGHEEDAKLAIADFERLLQMNPDNKEATKELRLLRVQMKKEEKDLAKIQRESYKNLFSGGKQLYDDASLAKAPQAPSMVYTDVDKKHARLLAVEEVGFHYIRGEPVLEGVTLDFCASRCIGLFGNNATGKSTLARLLNGKLQPSSGTITHCGSLNRAALGSQYFPVLCMLSPAIVVILAIVCATYPVQVQQLLDSAIWVMKSMKWMHWAVVAICVVALAILAKLALDARSTRQARIHSVLHVSSESSDKEEIPGKHTIEKVIGEKLPKHLLADERKRRVIAMLKASGFQMYNQTTGEPIGNAEEYVRDKLQYGQLSGGQRHLMYVLRALATSPDVLVCDEVLGGLDAFRQPRVLHMLRRMKEEMHTSILYISTELSQLKLMSDDIGYLSGGVISELGPAEEVLDCPKHPDAKEYVNSYRSLPGCHVIGGKLAENYTALVGDADLEGDWLPVVRF